MHYVHGVDLLERSSLAFADEEEDNKCGGKVASSEDVSVPEVDGAGDVRREESNQEIPCPVRRGGETH